MNIKSEMRRNFENFVITWKLNGKSASECRGFERRYLQGLTTWHFRDKRRDIIRDVVVRATLQTMPANAYLHNVMVMTRGCIFLLYFSYLYPFVSSCSSFFFLIHKYFTPRHHHYYHIKAGPFHNVSFLTVRRQDIPLRLFGLLCRWPQKVGHA